MKVTEIPYSPIEARKRNSSFKKSTKDLTNIIYFFYNNDVCLYVGETGTSLYHRCFKHTPKESKSEWFEEGNKIIVIILDDLKSDIENTKARQALEGVFILTNKPKYNKKG